MKFKQWLKDHNLTISDFFELLVDVVEDFFARKKAKKETAKTKKAK